MAPTLLRPKEKFFKNQAQDASKEEEEDDVDVEDVDKYSDDSEIEDVEYEDDILKIVIQTIISVWNRSQEQEGRSYPEPLNNCL